MFVPHPSILEHQCPGLGWAPQQVRQALEQRCQLVGPVHQQLRQFQHHLCSLALLQLQEGLKVADTSETGLMLQEGQLYDKQCRGNTKTQESN